jgi:hypothetical protein
MQLQKDLRLALQGPLEGWNESLYSTFKKHPDESAANWGFRRLVFDFIFLEVPLNRLTYRNLAFQLLLWSLS